jgi:hypothetical protein
MSSAKSGNERTHARKGVERNPENSPEQINSSCVPTIRMSSSQPGEKFHRKHVAGISKAPDKRVSMKVGGGAVGMALINPIVLRKGTYRVQTAFEEVSNALPLVELPTDAQTPTHTRCLRHSLFRAIGATRDPRFCPSSCAFPFPKVDRCGIGPPPLERQSSVQLMAAASIWRPKPTISRGIFSDSAA